jgi:hypothetical protein
MLYILLTWLQAPIWWPIALARRIATRNPKRILIAEIAGIGDVVCSASLFQALHEQYPDATIDLLIDPIAKGLSPILPMVNNVLLFAYPEQKGLKGRLKLARIVPLSETRYAPNGQVIRGQRLSKLPLVCASIAHGWQNFPGP